MPSNDLANSAYQKIRCKMIEGDYMPGTLLSENELAHELEMSRTPIRSAISRLEFEGFVVTLKNRGLLVKELSLKDLMEMQELIHSLLNFVIDAVIERGYTFDVPKLKEHFEQQMKATEADDYPRYIEHSLLFTRTLLTAAHNQMMLQTMDSFRDQMTRMAIINWKRTPNHKHYSATPINKRIYDAIASGDYSNVKQIFRESYVAVRERLVQYGNI